MSSYNIKFFKNIGFYANGVLNLTPSESFELCKKDAIIVDIRESYMNSFKMFQVDLVLYLPYSDLSNLYDQLPSDKPLIIADSVGLKSRESVLFLKQAGYENVANLAGGIVDWERDGLPLTTDIAARLSGSCMCQLKPREGRKSKK
jgi:rhodanese-related sulfurtransferase